jgi:hypothetical protein
MVHAVHDRISARIQEGRALEKKSGGVKESFPAFLHREHFVRRVTVQEKGLAEQGKEPVAEEKNKYRHIATIYGEKE